MLSALLPLTQGWDVWRRLGDYAALVESHLMEGNHHFLSVDKEKKEVLNTSMIILHFFQEKKNAVDKKRNEEIKHPKSATC